MQKNSSLTTRSQRPQLRHSVCQWCYPSLSLNELATEAKSIGIQAIELVTPKDYPTLKTHNLIPAVTWGVPGGIENGLNRLENHDAIVAYFQETIPLAHHAGSPNIVCFSGNRDGMDDQTGLENSAIGLRRIAPLAEKHGVTVILELLNSKIDHPDYMADSTNWGVELCHRVDSECVKLLFDIYHMATMGEDVLQKINQHHPHFAHYHTGGVPDRHEIDHTQTLDYPTIVKTIQDTGYSGFIGHEFIPSSPSPIQSLKTAIHLCTPNPLPLHTTPPRKNLKGVTP